MPRTIYRNYNDYVSEVTFYEDDKTYSFVYGAYSDPDKWKRVESKSRKEIYDLREKKIKELIKQRGKKFEAIESSTGTKFWPVSSSSQRDNSPYRKAEIDQRAIQLKILGFSELEIGDILEKEFGIKGYRGHHYYHHFQGFAAENYLPILTVHNDWYERLYKRFRELGMDKLAIKTLQQKEKLMNAHDMDVAIQINNIQTENDRVAYDLKRISKKERSRLLELMSKAIRKSPA